MGEAAVQHEHHSEHQNKHRQADNRDYLMQCGQPGNACKHDEHGGQHTSRDNLENALVPLPVHCISTTSDAKSNDVSKKMAKLNTSKP